MYYDTECCYSLKKIFFDISTVHSATASKLTPKEFGAQIPKAFGKAVDASFL